MKTATVVVDLLPVYMRGRQICVKLYVSPFTIILNVEIFSCKEDNKIYIEQKSGGGRINPTTDRERAETIRGSPPYP